MKPSEKKCPRCAEAVKLDALVCRHCGYEFSEADIAAVLARRKADQKKAGIGCVVFAVIGLLLLGMCSSSESDPKASAEAARIAAVDLESGKQCLTADGSSDAFVRAVKDSLRDPNSFEHATTIVQPADAKGIHLIVMEYRSRNGFGGMNALSAFGTLDGSDCSAKVSMSGVEEGR